ncbi:ABC transporter permease [Pseudolysinimonas yzui]|uniref:Monosaccharide-transporting ATPase n=1 Tax=Pseudolysinimonas yzui TaxID=2708254 RepID=A0A8J3GST3_9MICO|nr:ABC transporter permease [Pseudolysinimonas yzui]GHF27440.1 monosaccharide-transporting ATPase [Pseudolysinimonas yzui]
MSTSPITQGIDDRAIGAVHPVVRWVRTRAAWILLFDIALFALFTALSRNHVFFSAANAESLLISVSQILLLALGLAMMLGAGIFDLSLGANLVLSSVVGALVMKSFQAVPGDASSYHDIPLAAVAGFLACVGTGIVFGLVNGLLIAVGKINSLIATLGTLGIGTGIALLIAGGSDVSGMPTALQLAIGLNTIGIVPIPAIAAIAVAILLWVVVRFTRYGMRTQAIGSSRVAAERSGIRVRAHLLSLTVLGGGLAGMAGFIDLARFGSTALQGHANDALGAVTAAVIGGTLLEGGRISIWGAVWGAALAIILRTGLVILGVSAFWQLIVVGAVLLIAVLLDRVAAVRRTRSARAD